MVSLDFFWRLVRDFTRVLGHAEIVGLLHHGTIQKCACERVFLRFGKEHPQLELVLDVPSLVRVSTIQKFIDLVDGQNIRHVSHFVLIASQVDIQLKIVVVSYELQHGVIDLFLLHQTSHHVRVNELVDFFDGHVHAMVGRDVPLQLQEVPADVVNVNEAELLVDVVLSDVDVKVIIPVLIETGSFGSGPHVASHSVADNRAAHWQVFADDLRQSWVLTVWYVVEKWEVGLTTEHPEHTVDLSGENSAL